MQPERARCRAAPVTGWSRTAARGCRRRRGSGERTRRMQRTASLWRREWHSGHNGRKAWAAARHLVQLPLHVGQSGCCIGKPARCHARHASMRRRLTCAGDRCTRCCSDALRKALRFQKRSQRRRQQQQMKQVQRNCCRGPVLMQATIAAPWCSCLHRRHLAFCSSVTCKHAHATHSNTTY